GAPSEGSLRLLEELQDGLRDLVRLRQRSHRRLHQGLRLGQVSRLGSNVGVANSGFVSRTVGYLRLCEADGEVELVNAGADRSLDLTERADCGRYGRNSRLRSRCIANSDAIQRESGCIDCSRREVN